MTNSGRMDELNLDNDLSLYGWDFVEPPPNELYCGFCKEVFKSPMMIECCGGHFCAPCIEKAYGNFYGCPDCHKENVAAILDKRMWKRILELDVQCPFSNRGCLWTGELGARVAHLNLVSGDCEYVNTECEYGCGEKLEKNEIAEHLEMFCPKRPVTCAHCREKGEHELITGKHKSECPKLPVDCPNYCGAEVNQEDLMKHLQECPLEIVECEFSYAECNTQLPRKDMFQHLQEAWQNHMSLQAKQFILELEKKEEQLARIVKKHDDHLKEISEIHSKQLKRKDEMIEKLIKETEKKFQQEASDQIEKVDERILQTFKCKYDELKVNSSSVSIDEQTEIDSFDVELTLLLHEGKNRTEIWLGNFKGKEVAIKRPKLGVSPSSILGEAHFLRQFKHKNIVALQSTVLSGTLVCMVMEYVSAKNLQDYLVLNSPLLLHQQINICRQVASALEYLQQKLCIHRKIKAGNILVDVRNQQIQCKLKDFSQAIFLSSPSDYVPSQGVLFPIKWCAPEVIKLKRFCLKSDVWSYGMLVWEVVTGKEPFKDLSNLQASERIAAGTLILKPDECPDTFYTVMMCCWRQNPQDRPTAESLFSLLDQVPESHGYSMVDLTQSL